MIEINLLPEELRKTEGTPPARMLAIVGSVAAVCILGFFIGTYYMVKIPQIKGDLQTLDVEIKNLKEEVKKVDVVRGDISALKSKVAALENLMLSRIRYARVFDRLCTSVPDGVWFRTFTITNEASNPQGGKRYQISLTGYATGATSADMERKLTDLMKNMQREFSVRPEGTPPADAGPDYGWSKFVNAKFDAPILLGKNLVPKDGMPAPTGDDKLLKTIEVPKSGLDFQMTFSFELPAPKPT
jgi:Tfp pilus assembly protein PilN